MTLVIYGLVLELAVLVRLLGQASPIPFALCEVANQAWAINEGIFYT
jgi:hypothetical protein